MAVEAVIKLLLVKGPPYDQTEQLSRLTSPIGVLAISLALNFNFCRLLKGKWTVSLSRLPPVLTSNFDGDLRRHSMSA